jgi:hypothetical protein
MCHWWIGVGYVKVLEVMSGDDVCTCLRGRKSCGNSFVANIVLQVDISSAWSWLILYCISRWCLSSFNSFDIKGVAYS